MATDWAAVAAGLINECPSPTLRDSAITILERVELLGPLRSPRDEFQRVYRSLRWNEADRILQIVNALLPRAKGPDPKLVIRADDSATVIQERLDAYRRQTQPLIEYFREKRRPLFEIEAGSEPPQELVRKICRAIGDDARG